MRTTKEKHTEDGGAAKSVWIISLCDLMTLLMAFFALLFSQAVTDQAKVKQGMGSLMGSFGLLPGGINPESGGDLLLQSPPITPTSITSKSGQVAVQSLAKYIDLEALQDDIFIKVEKGSVTITISEKILFPPGESQISSAAFPFLDRIRGLIRFTTNDVVVEGHTDTTPINGERYSSNWELSGARAVSVVEYLLRDELISHERLAAAGYGEFKPLSGRESSGDGASNRRVSIVFLGKVQKEESQRGRDLVGIKGFMFKFKSYVWKQES